MPSQQYQQKPAIISAIQYDGTNASDVISFGNGKVTDDGTGKLMLAHDPDGLPSVVNVTDWVMKGPMLVVSSLTDAIFTVSYQPYP
jgi:hypothetical protein